MSEKYEDNYTAYGLSMLNVTSGIDQTRLSTSIWRGTMKITVTPKAPGDDIKFSNDQAISIFLSPHKAAMLAILMRNFKQDPDSYNGLGIATNKGSVSIMKSDMYESGDSDSCCLMISILNDNAVVSQIVYEFKRTNEGLVTVSNMSQEAYDGDYSIFANVEYDMLITALEQYADSANNAIAFSVVSEMRKANGMSKSQDNQKGYSYNNGYSSYKNTGSNSKFSNQKQQQQTYRETEDVDSYLV